VTEAELDGPHPPPLRKPGDDVAGLVDGDLKASGSTALLQGSATAPDVYRSAFTAVTPPPVRQIKNSPRWPVGHRLDEPNGCGISAGTR
jgi:hypothetical protein